jgi:superoxide dismutase, Fe-Mn family
MGHMDAADEGKNLISTGLSRRQVLAGVSVAAAGLALGGVGGLPGGASAASAQQPTPPPLPPPPPTFPQVFALPPLSFRSDALEPWIDTVTMQIHHDRHHGAFINNLNRLAAQNPILTEKPLETLLAGNAAAIPEAARTAFRNNAGGHLNHTLFWEILTPLERTAEPGAGLADAIRKQFESVDKLKEQLTAAAMTRFGSGWAWLVIAGGKLEVYSTANQDSPHMEGKIPVLGIDVWEHAYYLKYQNRRNEYLAAFWNVLNWRIVGQKYTAATTPPPPPAAPSTAPAK